MGQRTVPCPIPQQVTLMLEHLKSMEEYREGIAFIRNHME